MDAWELEARRPPARPLREWRVLPLSVPAVVGVATGQAFLWVMSLVAVVVVVAWLWARSRERLLGAPGRLARRTVLGDRLVALPPGARLVRVERLPSAGSMDKSAYAVLHGDRVLLRWYAGFDATPEAVAATAGLPYADLGDARTAPERRLVLPLTERRPHLLGLGLTAVIAVVIALVAAAG